MRSLTAKWCASRVLAIWKVALICVVADYSVLSYAQSPRVYRDRVEPHWFNNNQQFWYRVDLPKGGREFVVVDTIAGSRELAFDHSLVAASLSKLLDRPVAQIQERSCSCQPDLPAVHPKTVRLSSSISWIAPFGCSGLTVRGRNAVMVK